MQKTFTFLILVLFFAACTHQKKNPFNNYAPKLVESKGYLVPLDSMSEPKIILVDESKLSRIPIRKLNCIPTNTNVHISGNPKSVLAGIPRICAPGQDTFLLPKTVTAIDNPFVAGIPEEVLAKEPYIKDQNSQNFSTFNKLQGLRHNMIHCSLQDKIGNIWFGTEGEGVSKYNGNSFTHFTIKEGLVNNIVLSMLQDQSGNLWFGTQRGLSKFDGKSFTNFTEKEGLSNNVVSSIFQDQSGNIWIGTNYGINKYDGKTFTHFTVKEGLGNNDVLSILQDLSGNLWIGTYYGVNKFDGKSFTHYTEKEGLCNNRVYSILQDQLGNLWFCTLEGVSKYDGKSFTNFTVKEGLSNNIVISSSKDRGGNLWFGTYGGGVSKYDGKNFTHFTEREGLSNNEVWSILQDSSGNLWFGTEGGGVSRYDGKSLTHFTEKEGLSDNNISSIVQDKQGNFWFGTFSGGISKYDGEFFTQFTEKEGLSTNYILAISLDKKGNLWIGTQGSGILKYNGKFITKFTKKEGLLDDNVLSILQDVKGNLWFGTLEGVSKYDGKSFTNFTKKEGLSYNNVATILQDKGGNLWFGTYGGGVSKYDGKRFTLFTEKEGLSNNYINAILEDKVGNIWIGTQNCGVSRYDGKSFTNITQDEGLSNNTVVSILQDKSGNFWFGTRSGLNKITPENLFRLVDKSKGSKATSEKKENIYFKTYNYEDGFLGIGCNRSAIFEDKTGTIWIGANYRLTAYHPEGDEPDTIPPNIELIGISLFNEKINWTNLENKTDSNLILGNGVTVSNYKFDGISKWYNLPLNLSLVYNNNYLTFNFIGITQKQSKKVKYKYKLEGIDEDWSAITSRTEAPYGNLPHGNYKFKVKAMNSEGYWSSEYNYSFTIRPPWWKTWWFRVVEIIFIVSAITIYIKWREKKLRQDKNVLEETVKVRTAEVISQKEHIEYIHGEVSQSIDYATRIQTAILPEPDLLKPYISEHFVLYKPKDRVSGDFYWWTIIEESLVMAVGDCTGHGVPGAFMSMLGISFLREIVVKEYMTNPAIILKRLRKEIIHALKQKGATGEQKDGMDMALVTLNTVTLELQYAGANNPIYIISSLNNELVKIDPDKMPVSIHEHMENFTNHDLQLQKGDSIYLLTDGFEDQFGGIHNKKFMSKQLRELLVSSSPKSMPEQNKTLELTLTEWIGGREQTDDITVIGLRI
jgi:ligand-binding sensor domain-containing protein/serine phosphatase RsbU (regulator of sigma subunit)